MSQEFYSSLCIFWKSLFRCYDVIQAKTSRVLSICTTVFFIQVFSTILRLSSFPLCFRKHTFDSIFFFRLSLFPIFPFCLLLSFLHSLSVFMKLFISMSLLFSPISSDCRIHRRHLCKGVRLPHRVSCYDSKQSDSEVPVTLDICGIWSTRHCNCSQVHSCPEWEHLIGFYPYLLTPPLGQDMTQGQFFKRSLTGLNSKFSFS